VLIIEAVVREIYTANVAPLSIEYLSGNAETFDGGGIRKLLPLFVLLQRARFSSSVEPKKGWA